MRLYQTTLRMFVCMLVGGVFLLIAPVSADHDDDDRDDDRDDPVINEFVFNHRGIDRNEFVEIFGEPETDYSDFTILEIEGNGGNAGVVDGVLLVGVTDSNGFVTIGFLNNQLENGTITLLLVEDFAGSTGDDLDTDNDGILDTTPFSRLVDSVAVTDGGAGDLTYSSVVLAPGFDSNPFTPGGGSRIPNGTDTDSVDDWVRNDFDGEGLPGFIGTPDIGEALNTPRQTNRVPGDPNGDKDTDDDD